MGGWAQGLGVGYEACAERKIIIRRRDCWCDQHPEIHKMWSRTQLKTHDKFCRGGKAGHLVPWASGPGDDTHTYGEMLGRGETSDGRVVIEDETNKEETSDKTMCTEHVWVRWSTSSTP